MPASPASTRFAALRQAIVQEKRGLKLYRQAFLGACWDYADALRIRKEPDSASIGQRVLEDCARLKKVRDHLVDWILLESEACPSPAFDEAVVSALEQLLELRSRPAELSSWREEWLEAHRLFAYETFLYVIAALVRTEAFGSLRLILTNHYLLPETELSGTTRFATFESFYSHSDTLQILAPEGRRLTAPAAELVKRQADRSDLPFADVMQADLLILLMAFVSDNARWYPQTLHYSARSAAFPFFLRASRHRDFRKLAQITGIETGEALRVAVKAGQERLAVERWTDFWLSHRSFWGSMNMDALDTLA